MSRTGSESEEDRDEEGRQRSVPRPSYLVAVDEIYHPFWLSKKLSRQQRLATAIEQFWPGGHPTAFVHVSGTNGKGSVSHALERMLSVGEVVGEAERDDQVADRGRPPAAGSWTGPHLFDYAERFHVGGRRADHREIADIYHRRLRPLQEELATLHPPDALSFAELGILIALHLFSRHSVRWGIMESGAGGRYTPLMRLPVVASIITNVGNDHPRSLGTELWQRAIDKAGIIRPSTPVFTTARGEGLAWIRRVACEQSAPVVEPSRDARERVRIVLDGGGKSAAEGIAGSPGFVIENLALAAVAGAFLSSEGREVASDPLEAWSDLELRARLDAALRRRLPARFGAPSERTVIDVAHNADKVAALVEQIRSRFPGRRLHCLLGLTRRRDALEIFGPLLELSDRVVVSSASYAGQEPSAVAERLRAVFPGVEVIEPPVRAWEEVTRGRPDDAVAVMTGSAYLIDQALNPSPCLRHLNASLGWRGRSDQDR